MQSFKTLVFLFFLLPHSALSEPLLPPQPAFWKAKEKVYKKILEERAIIVSVSSKPVKSKGLPPQVLHMTGGGLISVPRSFAFKKAQDFSDLKKVSSHIQEVRYNAKDQTLYLHTEAFNYHAKMTMQLKTVEEDGASRIEFKVIKGMFLGLEGLLTFSEAETSKSEIGFFAGYRYKDLPMPKFFVEFGLEVVIQRISSLLRSHIESEYKK